MAITTTALIGAALAATVVGTGVQVAGAAKAAEAQQRIIEQEMKAEAERKKAMELDARRRALEAVRQTQKAQAISLTTATAQGAQYGSVLPGAYGGQAGQGNTNLLGIGQNLEIGRNLFDINQLISQGRIDLAGAQTLQTIGGGIGNLGGTLLNIAGPYGRLTGGGRV